MDKVINNNKCRVFIQDVEKQAWQLFSLDQRKRDGSIYLGSPEFTSFEWLTFETADGKLNPFKIEQDKEGHLSLHGSGQVHIESKDERYKLAINGQYLFKPLENDISLRHLFTLFPKKPDYIPISGAYNRKGDQVVKSSQPLKPFVIVAFAIPRAGLNLSFTASFDIDDLDAFPGGVLGMHLFPLVHHSILLFFYRTKFMDIWPKKTMLQYTDGLIIPIFMGKPGKMIDVQFRHPTYSLNDNELKIVL